MVANRANPARFSDETCSIQKRGQVLMFRITKRAERTDPLRVCQQPINILGKFQICSWLILLTQFLQLITQCKVFLL